MTGLVLEDARGGIELTMAAYQFPGGSDAA